MQCTLSEFSLQCILVGAHVTLAAQATLPAQASLAKATHLWRSFARYSLAKKEYHLLLFALP